VSTIRNTSADYAKGEGNEGKRDFLQRPSRRQMMFIGMSSIVAVVAFDFRRTFLPKETNRVQEVSEFANHISRVLEGAKPVEPHYLEGSRQYTLIVPNIHGESLRSTDRHLPPCRELEAEGGVLKDPHLIAVFQAKEDFHSNMESMLRDYQQREPQHFPRVAYMEGLPAGEQNIGGILENIRFTEHINRNIQERITALPKDASRCFSNLPSDIQQLMQHDMRRFIEGCVPHIFRKLALEGALEIRGVESPSLNQKAINAFDAFDFYDALNKGHGADWEEAVREWIQAKNEIQAHTLQTIVNENIMSHFLVRGYSHKEETENTFDAYNQLCTSPYPHSYATLEPIGYEQYDRAMKQTAELPVPT